MKKILFALLLTSALSTAAHAAIWEVDFNTLASWDVAGDPNNATLSVDLAAALGFAPDALILVDAIGWDVTINPVGDSWYSEAAVSFSSSAGGDGVALAPGAGDEFANDGGPRAYSSGGLIDLSSEGIADIMLLADGILVLEFFESFDDVADSVDSFWAGSLSVNARVVPVPAALPLLISALGLTGFLARRRDRQS